MSIKTNPFWIDGPVTPARFIGRRREVRKTFSQLTGPGQGSVAISGHRCTGKTSLLRYIAAPEIAAEWELTEDNALISLLDCQLVDHRFNVTAFWGQVLNLLQPHLQANVSRSQIAPAGFAIQRPGGGLQIRREQKCDLLRLMISPATSPVGFLRPRSFAKPL